MNKQYKKKPLTITAFQWIGHGEGETLPVLRFKADSRILVGKCSYCHNKMMDHGQLKSLEGLMTVCPGDYVITGIEGELYPCKEKIFNQSYEEVINGTQTETT